MIEQIANYPVQHFAQTAEEPRLIANSKATGGTLLGEIKHRLADCAAFDFCVAFVADGGLQVLVDSFNELEKRGVRGRLLTSTYLSFLILQMRSENCLNTTISRCVSSRETCTLRAMYLTKAIRAL